MARSVVLQLLVDLKSFEQGMNRAVSTASNAFGRVRQAAGRVGGAFGTVGKAAGKLGSAFHILGGNIIRNTLFFAGYFNALILINNAMQGIIQHALNLDEGLRKVQSITKESDETIEALGQRLLEMARKGQLAGKSAADIANGMFDIVQAGFQSGQALEIAAVAAEAAAAGFTEADTAGRAIVNVLKAFQLPAEQARHVADVLFKTVDVGIVTFEDLAQNIGTYIGTAALAKVSLEELGAAMAVLTLRGLPAAKAATSLNRIMLTFIKPSSAAADAAREMGIELNSDMLASKGLTGSLMELWEASGKNVDKFAEVFRNVRALRGAALLLTDDGEELVQMLDRFGASSEGAGALAEALEHRAKSLRYRMRLLGSQILALTDANGALTKTFGPIIDKISELIAQDSPLVKFVMNFVAGLGALVLAVNGGWFAIRLLVSALNPLVLGLMALAGVLTILDIPFARVLAAIRDFFVGILERLGVLDRFRLVWADLQLAIEKFRAGDLDQASIAIKWFLKHLLGISVTSADVRQKLAQLKWAAILLGRAFQELMKGDVEKFWRRLQRALEQVFGKNIGDRIFSVIKWLVEFTVALAKGAFEIGKFIVKSELFKSFVEGLRRVADVAFNLVIPALAKMLKWIVDHKPALMAVAVALGILLIWLNPIPAAIIAIIVAIGFLSRHWDEIKRKTLEVWNTVKNSLLQTWEDIKRWFFDTFGPFIPYIEAVWEMIKRIAIAYWNVISTQFRLFFDTLINIFRFFKAIFTGDWDAAWAAIKNIARNAWEGIKSLINFYLEMIKALLSGALTIIWQLMRDAWQQVSDETSRIWEGVKGAVMSAVDAVVGFFQALPGRLLEFLAALAGAGKELGSSIVEGIVEGISGIASKAGEIADKIKGALITAWNNVVQWLDDNIKIKIPGWNPPGPGSFPDIEWNPDFSGMKLAQGIRNFIGGLATVGERGAELISLPRGTNVYPAATASQALREAQAAGGPTIHTEVNVTTGLLHDYQELKRRVLAEVDAKLDEQAARAGLTKPRFGTWGAGIPHGRGA